MTAVQKSVLSRPYATQYRYDKAGNVTGILYPGSSAWLEYQYNTVNRVYAITGLAGGTLSNPAFAYDPAGNLRSVRVSSPKLTGPVLSLAYTYDGEGNILSRKENTYEYDELDRLTKATVKGVFADDPSAQRGYVTGDFLGTKVPDFSTGDSPGPAPLPHQG